LLETAAIFLSAFEDADSAFRETLHPEIEWCPIEENRLPLHGVDAAVRNRNAWLETWDEHRLDVEEVVEKGDSIVALGRGKGSGIEVDCATARSPSPGPRGRRCKAAGLTDS
jgi:hypothetical protein